jgi:V8-like Glu-specific endopeptidase
MKIARFTRIVASFLFTLMMVAQMVGSVQAAPANQDPPAPVSQNPLVTTKALSTADQAAALAYLTPAAMANAKPLPMPVDYGKADLSQAHMDTQVTASQPFSVAPGAANANADTLAKAAFPNDWKDTSSSTAAVAMLGSSAIGDAGPSYYTSYTVNWYKGAQKIYPGKWVGLLYIVGVGYCSATVIDNNTIITAAHCLFDTFGSNSWYPGWIFAPGWQKGKAPYGLFAADNCAVLTSWANLTGSYTIDGATPYDVGVCHLGLNKKHKTVNYMVGWAGYQYDGYYVNSVHNLGYPWYDVYGTPLPDAGQWLRTCTDETWAYSTYVMGMGCNWASGISGGSWMTAYAPNVVSGYVASVNSGFIAGSENLYGITLESFNLGVVCSIWGC